MIQRKLTPKELFWIVDQSAKSPPWVAAALFASGMFSNHMAEAQLLDKTLASLNVLAEHWKDTAILFLNKNFPNTSTEVLGVHMIFWELAEKFNSILSDFIATAGKRLRLETE